MLGRPEWFKRRKYGGWGFVPATWQGWVYTAAMVVPFIIFNSMPQWSTSARTAVFVAWIMIFGLDAIDIMIHLKKDEREKIHEAIAERNAAWVMIIVLCVGLAYQIARSAVLKSFEFDPVIAIALIGGLAAKASTNIYLDKTD